MKIATNFRVIASVDMFSYERDAAKRAINYARRAKELEAEIKRHCDGFDQTWIEWDSECSHCHLSWETDEKGEPVCCDKAQAEWSEAQSPAALDKSQENK